MIEALKWALAWGKRHDTFLIVVLFAGALAGSLLSLLAVGVPSRDAVFYTLQMIVLNYDQPEGATPGWLFFACRLTLPALASWALIKAYMTLADHSLDQWLARRCADHIVICGSDEQARTIAASHLAQLGPRCKSVVLLAQDQAKGELDKLIRDGLKVLEGDATDPSVLARFNVHRAAIIYIVSSVDEDNLRVLDALKQVRRRRAGEQQATCLVHLFNDYLFRQTSDMTKGWGESAGLSVVPFNSWQESARRAVVHIGPDLFRLPAVSRSECLHVLILGYSLFGQQLIEQFARLGHYARLGKLRVTLVSPCGNASFARLLTRFPALSRSSDSHTWGEAADMLPVIDVNVIEAPVDGFAASKRMQNIMATLSVAYVCTDDGDLAMAATNALLLHSPQARFPVFVTSTRGLHPIRHFVEDGASRVQVFDALEEGLQLADGEAHLRQHSEREAALVDLYFAQKYDPDRLPASLLHADVTDLAQALRGKQNQAAFNSMWTYLERYWRDLPEWMKESSRDTVRHLPIKQRAISDDFLVADLSASDRELLSRMEHQRWVAERLLSGWRYAPKREGNVKQRLHHDLVSFDRLSLQSQRKDASIIDIVRLLARERPSTATQTRTGGAQRVPAPITDNANDTAAA